jgi:hypothetical protein
MARQIIVASSAGNKAKTFNSNAQTWGELKREIGSLWNSGLEAIESVNKTTLSRDEAQLPQGDFNLFLVPTKNKAGAETLSQSLYDAIYKAVNDRSVDQEDITEVLAVVKSTISTFFAGTVAGSTAGSATSDSEAKAIADLRKFL